MQTESHILTDEQILHTNFIKQRQLILPSLLFLSGNQPLALISGQALHLFTPMLNLIAPNTAWKQWATLLSEPAGLAQLVRELDEER